MPEDCKICCGSPMRGWVIFDIIDVNELPATTFAPCPAGCFHGQHYCCDGDRAQPAPPRSDDG